MKYERFEDLPVWKDAAMLSADVFRWSGQSIFKGKGDLANQIQRAGLSISNNIAEGFERGTTKELLNFLYYARGSAGEVRSILCVMEMMPEFNNLKSDISNFKSKAESISRQLRGWANSLQNSDIKGQKHLNDQNKAAYKAGQSTKKFMDNIDQIVRKVAKEREK